MYFAAAAFLAGLALLAIPWWLHRLHAHSAEQRTFASLFLMRPSEAPVNMRKRLQHLLLLALRWLVLIAACLAFAQPILVREGTSAPAEEPEAHRLIVMDASLSMAALADGDRAFDLAQDAARELIGDLPSGVKAALISVADQLALVTPLTDDRSRLTGAVASLAPTSARLDFNGLVGRVTTLGETLASPGERLEVHLISDFQSSGMPDQFNALVEGSVWPVVLHPIIEAGEIGANRAVAAIRIVGGTTVEVSVRSMGAPGEDVAVTLSRDGEPIGTETIFVAANGTATATFTVPEPDPVDSRRRRAVTFAAELDGGDALGADDVRRLVQSETETTDLPVLAQSDRGWAYLRAAVQAAAPRFVPQRLSALDDPSAPVVVVLDPGTLAGGTDRILARYLESGGAVLLAAGPETRSAGRIPLIDLPLAADRFEQAPRGVMAVDRSHPALAGFGHWQDLTVFQAVRSAEQTPGEVILTLDDGTPLLTEHRFASGTLMVLGTALDPGWSTLVVRPAFVGFMANLLGYLAEDLLPADALVGQPFAIPAQNVQLFDSNGERVLGLADTVGRPTVSLAEPGIYQLRTPASTRLLAVNVDLAESDLTPAPAGLLERWENAAGEKRAEPSVANGVRPGVANGVGPGVAAESTHEIPLGIWFLALLALLVLIEPLFANLGSGGPPPAREPAID